MSSITLTRRLLLGRTAVLGLGLAASALPQLPRATAAGADTIKVGVLHSLTGAVKEEELPLRDAELLAIEEINAKGGVLGKRIEVVIEDPESKITDIFPEKAKKLLLEDKVACVFGCWTSVSRKNVLPVFEANNALLFYPPRYEGNETSKNVVYTGSLPNQQALPAVDWLKSKAGGEKKNFYLLGSDYIYPRMTNAAVSHHLKGVGLTPVGTNYVPLEQKDFRAVVRDIVVQRAPDVVLSTLIGDSHIAFFDELATQGITPDKVPVLSLDLSDREVCPMDPKKVAGHLAAASYFQAVDTKRNQEFVKAFRAKYGKDQAISATVEAAYTQVYLWKLAVEKAKSVDVDQVRKALRGLEFEAPGGQVKVDEQNLHSWKPFRVGRITKDLTFELVYEAKTWIAPEPYHAPLKPPRD